MYVHTLYVQIDILNVLKKDILHTYFKGSKFYAHMYTHTHPHYTHKLQNYVLSNGLDQSCMQ